MEKVESTGPSFVDGDKEQKSPWMGIDVPKARDRMLEYFEREQVPGDVRSTLAAALQGDLHYQSLLFAAMIDSWPKLQKNLAEVARQVSISHWDIYPYTPRGSKPSPQATQLAQEIESDIWRMKPDPTRGELSIEGFLKVASYWYFLGHGVAEIRWEQKPDGSWVPRTLKDLPARYFGYPYDPRENDPEDRLMLDPTGSFSGSTNWIDFPEGRFLIGVNKGHNGHPSQAAPLRALTSYWLAAVYGLKYLMNFTQLYGIPWRHAKVDDPSDSNVVTNALAKIGTLGYIVTGKDAELEILEAGSTSGSLPQAKLIELADQQCDQFILGATLTGGTDGSGSRALGEVHQNTKVGVVAAVADFVGEIVTYQLIPAMVKANWGSDVTELPSMWANRGESKPLQQLADLHDKLGIMSGNLPVSKAWFYETHNIPIPGEGEQLLVPTTVEPSTPAIPPSVT